MKMVFGYIRQNSQSELQKEEIKTYYSENFSNLLIKFFEERIPCIKNDPSQFEQLKKELREGDILIIYNLKQLAENSQQLIKIVAELIQKKIVLYTLEEKITISIESAAFLFNWLEILKDFDLDVFQRDKEKKVVDPETKKLAEKFNTLEQQLVVLKNTLKKEEEITTLRPKSNFYSKVIFNKEKITRTYYLHSSLVKFMTEYANSVYLNPCDVITAALIDYISRVAPSSFLEKITPEYLNSVQDELERKQVEPNSKRMKRINF
jgi:hypothetical protein